MNRNLLQYYLVFFLAVSTLAGCIDQDFDEPPVGDLPNLMANATIADLKALHTIGTEAVRVEDPLVIEAVVTADDRSGNFFRQIAIEDETGGIILRLFSTGLYNQFPVGRQIFVNCQGLFIGDYNGLPQINGSPLDPIEELLIPEYVQGGRFDQEVNPTPTTIDAFDDDLIGRLIELNDVQFAAGDTAVTYADAANQLSVNRTLEDCDGNSVIIRTSGFADFAGARTPTGNGRVVAVLTIFGDTRQLILRDLTDVTLEGARCGGGGSGGDVMPIANVREEFSNGVNEGPEGWSVRGIVISDKDAGNIDGRNLVLQDGSGGIVIRFQDIHNFSLGEELELPIGGEELSEFNGLLQVTFVPNNSAISRGAGSMPTPRMATVQEIVNNAEAWESTLVVIDDATISGSTTFNGSTTVSDPSGATIPMFTRSAANFADQPLPAGAVTLTGIVGDFNGVQLNLRNLSDVNSGGGGGDPELMTLADLRDSFEGGAVVAPVARKIRGVVISDIDSENTTGRNLVIQDASGGVVVRFVDVHNFALGEELEIVISGQELSEFNGLFQVNNVSNANAVSFGNGTPPEPRVATILEINNNLEEWESTLVRIENVTISGGSTYDGLLTLDDGTASIGMFTRSQATFASASVPAGTVTVIGMVSQFNDPQINIRNLNDILP